MSAEIIIEEKSSKNKNNILYKIIKLSFGKISKLCCTNIKYYLGNRNQTIIFNIKKKKKSLIKMKYKSKENKIKLLGEYFVYLNKNKCLIIYNNKESKLISNISPINKKDILKVKLKILDDLIILEQMFYECCSLISISEISYLKLNKIKNIDNLFSGCCLLESLPDLSKLNTKNMTSMIALFFGCSSLINLPDISKWKMDNIESLKGLFFKCISLKTLPDISKWKTNKVKDLSLLFYGCSSLKSLPDLSKWNVDKVENTAFLFGGCSSLKTLPDISKWNLFNNKNKPSLFHSLRNIINKSPENKIINEINKFFNEIWKENKYR